MQLFVGDQRTLDFALEVGAVQDSVTVTSAPPLLDEASATRGGVIENLRVTELPLNSAGKLVRPKLLELHLDAIGRY